LAEAAPALEEARTMRLVGPILYFRGQTEDRWYFSALLVREGQDEPPPLETSAGGHIVPQRLAFRHEHGFWRYDFSLPLQREETAAHYAIAEERWPIRLPAFGGSLRLAYTACSGTEDDGEGPPPSWRNLLWRRLAAEHEKRPFHLLLQGGDQLYADTLWEKVPELAAWRRLPWRKANAVPFTPAMAEGADRYYLTRYRTLFSQPEIAAVQATLPSVMMWDDHDIFDGWGSWPEDRQECPVFQGLFGMARDHFALFQLGARPRRLPGNFSDSQGGHFGCAYAAGRIGILAPDLRSERSRQRVMGEAGWRDFKAALAAMAGCRHLLIMSSVPLTHIAMPLLERFYTTLPGHSDLEDDLRDQWQSVTHRDEWKRMLEFLVGFSARTGARVTSLSGEIHLGALAFVEGRGVRVLELTSSGIVHPPPGPLVVAAAEWLARTDTVLGPDLRVRRLKIPGHGRRYLRQRNWLALEFMGDGRFEAEWHTEHDVAGRLVEPTPDDGD
jgi:hypothetical protein